MPDRAKTVCLIRPLNFAFNPETAASNIFQAEGSDSVSQAAIDELSALATSLEQAGVNCIVLDDRKNVVAPDAVFPNNWFSTHSDGTVVLYPLLSSLRRAERRADLFDTILPAAGFRINRILDFTSFEARDRYLEGTGSLVFDHVNKKAYACLSSRTDKDLAAVICNQLGMDVLCFDASASGKEIYHTNVLMSVGTRYSVLCSECIVDVQHRKQIIGNLTAGNRALIDISLEQLYAFAGNTLELQDKNGNSLTVISTTAFRSLRQDQISLLEKSTTFLEVSIPVIEKTGGGSVRCMMAEIFLPKIS